jgi:pSer/pThr/pTyr-binding forkhead associated (FHA) protein
MQLEIVVQNQRAESRRLVLPDSGVLTFGRHPDSSVCLEGDSVSRTHALVRVENGRLRVEDRSTNGTWA